MLVGAAEDAARTQDPAFAKVQMDKAKLAGFDMTIVDPRTAFATPERFPDAPVIAGEQRRAADYWSTADRAEHSRRVSEARKRGIAARAIA